MHLQTIVHSVAFFGIENAAAPVSGQPREIHSKARFGLQDESVQGIARGSLPLKASAAQAVAAFFTRVFYHTPGRLSSIFMREFEILCLVAASRLSLWESWREAPERASPARQSRHTAIGRLFVRAILSLCLCFSVSVLALSVTFGDTARVAAPSIRSASLASCWPRPQQFLPVSAAGGGRRRCSQRERLCASHTTQKEGRTFLSGPL